MPSAEDTFFPQQYFLTDHIIIINSALVFTGIVKICQSLSMFCIFLPVSYERNVEQHISSKYCCTWKGFKHRMVGRANGPCGVWQEDVYVTGFHRLSHIKFGCAQHVPKDSMNTLQYSIPLWVLNTGWLTLYPVFIAQGLEVKFEFASIVVYYVSTTWISTKPVFIHQVTDLS